METQSITVQGIPISMTYHPPAFQAVGAPLLVTLHGGTYTSAYFEIAGGAFGSFNDLAARNGFGVLAINRPGYGGSGLLPEEENTFARQAELLEVAIEQALRKHEKSKVVIVGHSIGAMIGLEIAARQPQWPIAGLCVTGMCGRIPPGGAAEQLAAAPLVGVVDLPAPAREPIMFGPPGSFSEAAKEAAKKSYAPTPVIELKRAPRWARERLREVAAKISVPVQNFVAEFDALWDSSAESRAELESAFGGRATSRLAKGVGHSIDHHLLAAQTQLQQLAFASAV